MELAILISATFWNWKKPTVLPSTFIARVEYEKTTDAFLTPTPKRYKNFAIYYAIKANNHPAILHILAEEGAGFDCSSSLEIELAKKISHKILYTGCYESHSELMHIVKSGVKINLDNIHNLESISVTDNLNTISFRINPGIAKGGYEGLIFAGDKAKFGIDESQVEEAYTKALQMGFTRFGAHMMVSSNILDPNYFEMIVSKLMDIIGPISKKLGITFDYIDIGGSLGIPYFPHERELDIELVAKKVCTIFQEKLNQYQMGNPLLIHEPGRYLVGDAGILLTKITSIKESKEKFVGVDAGINTLLRPALDGAYHHIVYINNLNASCDTATNVVGSLCTNKDIFVKQLPLPSNMQEGRSFSYSRYWGIRFL